MQITKLRLSGFKSFAEPTDVLIEPGLTGIVGPNGCGKSNIVEALRWVMGESSAKGLRGGEMDDVIFNGAAKRPAFDLAEVGLKLRGVKTDLAGVSGEVDISRRIGRGVGSTYRINGRETRARDVQTLFADGVSGARSAAIVGQGQISALVEARPTDRRRLLEEAAGISGLQGRRREAELKLEAASANLERLQDIVATFEEQKTALDKQAQQARRYAKLGRDIRTNEALLLLARWRAAQGDVARAAERIADAEERWTTARSVHEATRQRRSLIEQRLPELRRIHGELTAQTARLSERTSAVEAASARRDHDRRRLERTLSELEDDRHARGRLAEDARASLERLAAELRDLEDEHAGIAEQLEPVGRAEAEARQQLDAADTAMRDAFAARAEAEADLRGLGLRRDEAAARLGANRQQLEQANARLAALTTTGDDEAPTASRIDAEKRELDELTSQLVVMESDAASAVEFHARLRREAADADARRNARHTSASDVEARRTAAREERRRLDERQTFLATRRGEIVRHGAEIAQRAETCEQALAALGTGDLEQQTQACETRRQAAARAVEEARRAHDDARSKREAVREQAAELRAMLDRFEGERAALEEPDDESERAHLIDQLRIDDGYATALAAALGDDLLAGTDIDDPTHWRALDGAGPALPAAAEPMSRHVTAPAALDRRLGQVGIVDAGAAADLQPSLAQGQRLVSRDGGLWRWDGFVRQPGVEDVAAAQLRRRQRRGQLDEEIGVRRARLSMIEADEAAILTGLAGCEQAEKQAGHHLAKADAELADARAALATAQAAAAARNAESEALARQQAQLDDDSATLDADTTARDAQSAAMPDPTELDADLAAAREALAAADRDRQTAALEVEAAEAERVRGDARLSDLRRQTEDARRRHDASRQANEDDLRRQAVEHTALSGERQRLTRDIAGDAALLADLEPACEAASQARTGLCHKLDAGEAHLIEARELATLTARELGELRERQTVIDRRREQIATDRTAWHERAEEAARSLGDIERRIDAARTDLAAMAPSNGEAADSLTALRAELSDCEREAAEAGASLAGAEAEHRAAENDLETAEAASGALREERAVLDSEAARLGAAFEAASQQAEERLGASPAALYADLESKSLAAMVDLGSLQQRLDRYRASRERIGPVNLRAEVELDELCAKIATMHSERDELTAAIERLRRAIGEINREGRHRLLTAFGQVEEQFGALFKRLFGGGEAHLRLIEDDDPLAFGLELDASPPGKKLASVSLLSGGEKALTALALIFALFLTQPSPICVLDEVDAPLDDANVVRLIDLMDEIAETTGTNFLVVTHHPLTMARMNRLYGVTMVERGLSRLVSVALEEAVELRATA